jgi:ribosomal protein S18 acetylase RimI-like enzyme
LLPSRYEQAEEAASLVEAAWRKPGATGVAATRDGTLFGYLVGAPDSEDSWGANHWVDQPGHAAEEPELVRDLYGALAAQLYAERRGRHYVLVPAGDAGLADAWFRVGFGQQQAHGIREVGDLPWPEQVREAEPRDVDALLPLALAISRHHQGSPVFSDNAARHLERAEAAPDDLRAQIETDIAAEAIATLVAEVDRRVVGLIEVCPVELASQSVDGPGALGRPEGACYLAFAATDPEARGLGAGVDLTTAAFAWAHRAGYRSMVTDWRVTNLLASRFWPQRGFRTTFLRLYRSIP